MSNKLQYLVLHCTATPEGRFVGPDQIIEWHTSAPPKGRGWKRVGYSMMFLLDGTPITLVGYNDDDVVDPWEITNGVAGINSKTRHIVYVGGTDSKGKPKDTRTPGQLKHLAHYVKQTILEYPSIEVGGHNQFDPHKACPSFDVPAWLRSIGVKEENIYKP